MKLMHLIRLNERKQVGEVYHFTLLKYFVDILAQDFLRATYDPLKLKGNMGTDYEYRISTTRDRNFLNRQDGHIAGDEIGLILDGSKLSSNYKTMPTDDNYQVTRKTGKVVRNDDYGDEMEQMWYGNKMERDRGIKNIDNYISGIILTKKVYEMSHLDSVSSIDNMIRAIELINENGYEVEKPDGSDIDINYMLEVLEDFKESI